MTVAAVTVHYQTPNMLRLAVESFRKYYPAIPLLIIDNGSNEAGRHAVQDIESKYPAVTRAVYLPENIFHGPAMHRAMGEVAEDLVFFFDTDTEMLQGGLLETMASLFEQDLLLYAAGKTAVVNARGFHAAEGTTIVQTPSMMIRRSLYHQLPPFEHRGMPTLANFQLAHRMKYRFADVPVEHSIRHDGRGTAGKFGYGLGLRGKMEFAVEKIVEIWSKSAATKAQRHKDVIT